MRIVYTVLDGRLAGGQMICGQILLAARDAGHEVCLVTPSFGEFTEIIQEEGIPIIVISMEHSYHIHRAWQFARFLKDWGADVVHCHAAVVGTILARIGAKIAGTELISHVHIENKFSERTSIRKFQIWLDNWTARFAQAIIAISEDTRQNLIRQGLPPEAIRVVYNGVNLDSVGDKGERALARNFIGLNGVDLLVGTIARLCPVKGQREFIQAASRINAEFPQTKFVIVGEDLEFGGRYRLELEELVSQMNLQDDVIFTGYLHNAAKLMYAFDVFVLPSWIEGMPVTILEAMAAGIPVVATPVGGVPELVLEGKTGLLVSPDSPQRLAEAIVYLLKHRDKAHLMGRAGRERVWRHFSKQQMVERIFALYDAISHTNQ